MNVPRPAAVTFVAVDPRNYYDPKDGSLDHIRRNHRLPLIWTHLSPGDVAEIRSAVRANVENASRSSDVEPSLAVECILTTGRTLQAVSKLHYFGSAREFEAAQHAKQIFGLINHDKEPYWILPQGNARRARTSEALRRKSTSKSERLLAVRLPASELTMQLLAVAKATLGATTGRIFQSSLPTLKRGVERLLKERCTERAGDPRWISTRLQTLERYFANELLAEAGGDPATSIRITDWQQQGAAVAAAYYVPGDRESLNDRSDIHFDLSDFVEPPPKLALREFIESLMLRATQRQSDLVSEYEAFLGFAVEFIAFGIGLRGNFDTIPSTASIDPPTGFCQVHDKSTTDAAKARLVWVPNEVRRQIANLEIFHRRIWLKTGDQRFIDSAASFPTRIRFPDLRSAEGFLDLRTILLRNRDLSPDFCDIDINIGRRWLRTQMIGRCSTETTHAFLGHWLAGMEPWSYGSCFDPLSYRADLERAIPSLLNKLGWRSISMDYLDKRNGL